MRTAALRLFFIVGLQLACPAAIVADPAEGLYWSVQRDGEVAGYLLGTIHSEDPRVLDFSEAFLEQVNSCSKFAMEIVPDLPTLARLAEVMLLPEGQSLPGLIGDDLYAQVSVALGSYGIPDAQLRRMKPWAAMMTLSVPPPETGFFMDFSLSLRAAGSGLEVIGLETLDEQLGFLENMSLGMQRDMLVQAVAEAGQVHAAHDKLVELYLANDLAALEEEARAQMADVGDQARAYFIEHGIELRNQRMFDRLQAALAGDRVFVAVGALHLPGDTGLIRLLRQAGYRLQPLPLPFGSDSAAESGALTAQSR
ncbi:MAG: TraB/GumN family protein [Xanthomonadales bacterium]|nr:TraB/GumN family protein [Xanthomonadales bacterium]